MKGLSFSEPMIRAWLEGRKSVTRRMMNPQPVEEADLRKPRYTPGETVYIKEVWSVESGYLSGATNSLGFYVEFKAGGQRELLTTNCPINKEKLCVMYDTQRGKWRSPMMMPEWASRDHALIENVRAERIQEITAGEAAAEGCEWPAGAFPDAQVMGGHEFVKLWETLHPGSWDRNDWVWRYGLRRTP